MNGTDSAIKNIVFLQVKSGQIITTLFPKSDVILSEPSDIEEAPTTTGTLKIHKFRRYPPTATGETQINFFFLSNSKEPCCTQKYATKKRCGHVDHDFDSHAQFRSTCVYCREKRMDVDEIQDWLRCPMCMQRFHDACFEQ